jgi:hypothetical protein
MLHGSCPQQQCWLQQRLAPSMAQTLETAGRVGIEWQGCCATAQAGIHGLLRNRLQQGSQLKWPLEPFRGRSLSPTFVRWPAATAEMPASILPRRSGVHKLARPIAR